MSEKKTQTPATDVSRPVLRLTESAILLALATVLSLVKLIDLPYGGSVTAASAVPLVLLAHRYGSGWGLMAGLAYGLLQLATGSSLSYVTGFWSVVAVLVLDYLLAFAAVGLSGLTRRMKNQATALLWGAVIYGVVRYILHVLSGATVWAGISIPTAAALTYSFGYNLTYMLPETIIAAAAAYFLGSVINFRSPLPSRLKGEKAEGVSLLKALATGLITAAAVYDVAAIFPYTQDPESGDFTFARLGEVNWTVVAILTGAAVVAAAVLVLVIRRKKAKASEE